MFMLPLLLRGVFCEEVDYESKTQGNTMLIFKEMSAKTISKPKPFYLESATLYKFPENGDRSKVVPVKNIETSEITGPKDYESKQKVFLAYDEKRPTSWTAFTAAAGNYPKILEINARESGKRPNQRAADGVKISEVVATLYDKSYEFDLSEINFEEGETYVLQYQVKYNVNKPTSTFFSLPFKYNSKGKYLELSDGDETNWVTSWWAIVLYVLGGLLIIGLVVAAFTK